MGFISAASFVYVVFLYFWPLEVVSGNNGGNNGNGYRLLSDQHQTFLLLILAKLGNNSKHLFLQLPLF